MAYKLKQTAPEFDMVDGPLAGKQYRRGQVYEIIPQQYAGRFEKVKAEPQTTQAGETENAGKGGKKR
jgi:hypothetical protein